MSAEAITFDEYETGTTITNEYASKGVVFTSDVFLTTDDSGPTSPVLSGVPKFHGDISGRFTRPGTEEPSTVLGFELDIGYIDNRNSVEITWFDSAGNAISSTRAQSLGTNHISVVGAGIASFTVREIDTERAGFEIDNLEIRRTAVGLRPTRMVMFGDSYSSGEGLVPERGLAYDCGTDMHENSYFENTTAPFYGVGYWPAGAYCDTVTGSTNKPKDLAKRKGTKYKNLCHRQRRAYPNQVRTGLGVNGPDALFIACSGAVTRDVGAVEGSHAQYPLSPVNVAGGKTQIDTASDFAASRAPDFITIGIGGNDAGFSQIVKECIKGDCDKDLDFMSGVVSTINGTTYRDVLTTLKALRSRFPTASIAVFGYPTVVDQAQSCFGQAPGIGDGEMGWLKDTVLPTLNDAIKDAAAEAGLTFIDITSATAGHGVCSSDPWVNGVRGGDDIWGVVGNESFHPNQRGHDAIAKLFLTRYTDGAGRLLFTNVEPADPIRSPTGPEIQLGTLSAGAVDGCGPACTTPAPCLQACAINLQGNGYAPSSDLNVVLQSTPTVLGQVRTGADGRLVAAFKLPATVTPGVHSVTVDGPGSNGRRQHSVELIRVYQRGRSSISTRFRARRTSTRVRRLRITRIQPGQVVMVCARKRTAILTALAGRKIKRVAGCSFTRRTLTVPKYVKARNFARYFTKPLRPGVRVRVVVSAKDFTGRSLELVARRGRKPKATSGCTAPGKLTIRRC